MPADIDADHKQRCRQSRKKLLNPMIFIIFLPKPGFHRKNTWEEDGIFTAAGWS
jgi:hypothetical protein